MRIAPFLVVALAATSPIPAQGLRLFGATGPNETQLVDSQGVIVHRWPGVNSPSVYLLDDGSLLRASVAPGTGIPGATGRLQRLSFDGTVTWDMLVNSSAHYLHHDIEPMPNGNVLVIVWDRMTDADAIAAGRDPALLTGADWFPDGILEIQPTGPTTGTVVWEWHVMDHVVQDFDATKANYGIVGNHPELLDINYPAVQLSNGDWNHCNGIDYDEANDWIVLSAREQSEVYLIDHSTTTAEAAGHTGGARGKGGDFLWRWGNPQVYRRGTLIDRKLFFQHDPRFVPQGYPGHGHVTIFNNNFTPTQSAVLEVDLPLDANGSPFVDPVTGRFGPALASWTYTDATFYSQFVSSAQRLANGNTLICSGMQQRLFEVTPAGQTVWTYQWPGTNFIFQAHDVDRRLWSDAAELSASAGGRVGFSHLVDTANAGHMRMLLGSLSGTSPGLPLPGGVTLPLNLDVLTLAMAESFNVGIFVDTLAAVDTTGNSSSALVVPGGFVPAALVGLRLDFAHLVFDAGMQTFETSNVTSVTITP